MKKMQAIHYDGTKEKVSLIQTCIPDVSATSVLVKVFYSGVCGTDLHIIEKEFPAADSVILGHEFSGVVEKVGGDVRGFSVGDRVVVNPNRMCGSCTFCMHGHPNHCPTALSSIVGIFQNGGFAEYCAVHFNHVIKIPDSLSFEKAALCEPYSCILRGWENIGDVPADAKVLILGAGIIGLLWASLFHHHGNRDVTISEIAEGRRKIAMSLGLGFDVLHESDVIGKFENVDTAIEGFDFIIDCTGAPKAIENAFPLLRRGAKLCMFGCCPKVSKITINPHEVYLKELTIVGVLINPFAIHKAVSLVGNMAERYLDFDRLGVQTFSLGEYREAIDGLKRGDMSKAMFCVNKA